MTDEIRLGENIVTFLDEQISVQDGFMGARLDEDIVRLIEEKLGQEFFWGVVVDRNGGQTLIVPRERASARTFPSQKALWEHVGRTKIEEVEDITMVRLAKNSDSTIVEKSKRNPSGGPCIRCSSLIESK